jgi:hypothetical protein
MSIEFRHDVTANQSYQAAEAPSRPVTKDLVPAGEAPLAPASAPKDRGVTGPLRLASDPTAMNFDAALQARQDATAGTAGGTGTAPLMVDGPVVVDPQPETHEGPSDLDVTLALGQAMERVGLLAGQLEQLPPALRETLAPILDRLQRRMDGCDLSNFVERKDLYEALMALRRFGEGHGSEVGQQTAMRMVFDMTVAACDQLAAHINQAERMGAQVVDAAYQADASNMEVVDLLDTPLSQVVSRLAQDTDGSPLRNGIVRQLSDRDVLFNDKGNLIDGPTGRELNSAEVDALGQQIQQGLVEQMQTHLVELETISSTFLPHCDSDEIQPLMDLTARIKSRSQGIAPQNNFEMTLDGMTNMAMRGGAKRTVGAAGLAGSTGSPLSAASGVEPEEIAAITSPQGIDARQLSPAMQQMLADMPPEAVIHEGGRVRINVTPEQRQRLIAAAQVLKNPTSPAGRQIRDAILNTARSVQAVERFAKAAGTSVAAMVQRFGKPALLQPRIEHLARPAKSTRARRAGQADQESHQWRPHHVGSTNPTGTAAGAIAAAAKMAQAQAAAQQAAAAIRREAQFADILRERPDDLVHANRQHQQEVANQVQAEAQQVRADYQAALERHAQMQGSSAPVAAPEPVLPSHP